MVSSREDLCDQSLSVSFARAQLAKSTKKENTHEVRCSDSFGSVIYRHHF